MIPETNPTARAPFLSILLVNFNGLRHLEECLASVSAQDFRSFEVVLVDNASTDGSAEFVRARFPDVNIVDAGANLGFAGGNNLGIRHCRGEWIFLLNNDTRLEPGALSAIHEGTARHPDYRIFACFMLNHRDPTRVDNAGEAFYRAGFTYGFSGWPSDAFKAPREVVGACGGAAVFRADVLRGLEGFDEDFFLIFEDVDLCCRARHLGEKILFLPDARVLHKGSASIGGQASDIAVYYATRNYLFFLIKNFPIRSLVVAAPGALYGMCSRFVNVSRRGQSRVFLRALRDAARLFPEMLRRRRRILAGSKISSLEFGRLFRSGWLRESRAFRRGDFSAAP